MSYGGRRVSGAALTMRVAVIAYVGLLVILPLAALLRAGLADGPLMVWHAVSTSIARDAILLSLWTAALATVVNVVAGTTIAWVLVRFLFPGKQLLSALVDMPFAVPTLVTGVTIVLLFGPTKAWGEWFTAHGIAILYAPPAIVLALLFITMPFVVRAVEPVLRELDTTEEEAAYTLGAKPMTVLRRVVLPALAPAITSGALQGFSRCLAEFGSIVIVAGNIPHRTLTGPVYVFGEVESGRPEVAAAASVALLLLSLVLSYAARVLRRMSGVASTHV